MINWLKNNLLTAILIAIIMGLLVWLSSYWFSSKPNPGIVIIETEYKDSNNVYHNINYDKDFKELKEKNKELYDSLKKYKNEINHIIQFYYQKEYDTFKIMEGKILAAGYASVEQYNALINQRYNEPAKAAAEKNAATQVTIKDTYSIQEAEVKSGRLIPVSIKHSFEDTSLNYTEEFEIDANDIITFNSINAAVETTSLGYGFYYHTDDDHQIGYWWESFSSVGTNAVYHLNSWNSGDSHSISFKVVSLVSSVHLKAMAFRGNFAVVPRDSP